MKRLFKEYLKMIRAGFFLKSMFMPLVLTIPAIVAAFGFNVDIFGLYLIIMGGFTVQQIILNEVSQKRYVLLSSLPIEVKEVIRIGYLHTYLIYAVSLILYLSISSLTGEKLPLQVSLYFVLFALSANIFYPYFASAELKLGVNQQDKGAVWAVVILSAMILLGGFGFVAARFIDSEVLFYGELLVLGVLVLMVIATTKRSYNITINKIMGYRF
jgi:hypothetical protein